MQGRYVSRSSMLPVPVSRLKPNRPYSPSRFRIAQLKFEHKPYHVSIRVRVCLVRVRVRYGAVAALRGSQASPNFRGVCKSKRDNGKLETKFWALGQLVSVPTTSPEASSRPHLPQSITVAHLLFSGE